MATFTPDQILNVSKVYRLLRRKGTVTKDRMAKLVKDFAPMAGALSALGVNVTVSDDGYVLANGQSVVKKTAKKKTAKK